MILTPHLYQGGRTFAPVQALVRLLSDLEQHPGEGGLISSPVSAEFDRQSYFRSLVPWLDPSATSSWLKMLKSDANPDWEWTFSTLESPGGYQCTIATLDGATSISFSQVGLERLRAASLVAATRQVQDRRVASRAIARMLSDSRWWTPDASKSHAADDRANFGGAWVDSAFGQQPIELLSAIRYDLCVHLLNGYDLAHGWDADDYAVVPWDDHKHAFYHDVAKFAGLIDDNAVDGSSSKTVKAAALGVALGAAACFIGRRM